MSIVCPSRVRAAAGNKLAARVFGVAIFNWFAFLFIQNKHDKFWPIFSCVAFSHFTRKQVVLKTIWKYFHLSFYPLDHRMHIRIGSKTQQLEKYSNIRMSQNVLNMEWIEIPLTETATLTLPRLHVQNDKLHDINFQRLHLTLGAGCWIPCEISVQKETVNSPPQKAPKIFYSFQLPLSYYYYYYLYSLSSRAHGMRDPLTHRKLLGHNWTVVAILRCPWASYLLVWIILCRWSACAFGAANRLHNKMQRNIFSRVDAWCENLRIYMKILHGRIWKLRVVHFSFFF